MNVQNQLMSHNLKQSKFAHHGHCQITILRTIPLTQQQYKTTSAQQWNTTIKLTETATGILNLKH